MRARRPAAGRLLVAVISILLTLVACGDAGPRHGVFGPTDDPRYAACLGDPGGATPAFEVEAGEDWRHHFPNHPAGETFDRDGLVLIFPNGWPGVVLGENPPPPPGRADICFWFGSREAAEKHLAGEVGYQHRTIFGDVDIAGLRS